MYKAGVFFVFIICCSSSTSQSIDEDAGYQTMCESEERIVYPKVAQNQDGNWLFIVNHADYQQGVRVEQCKNADGACRFSDYFPLGSTTICKQKYILKKMLALNDNGVPEPGTFKLPSSCVCHVRLPEAELGILANPNPQTPIPSRK